jgi:methylenetetrahydrofolate dehydrogenase (NADP+)/methenyltetrahydrofolate cyclohydrolase
MATIIDGTAVSAAVRGRVAERVEELVGRSGHTPGLVTILVGADPASQVYVRSKGERCREVGMTSFHEELPETATQAEVLDAVDRWNADDRCDGILVQAPLPEGLDFKQVLDRIDPSKDVDGFHPISVGRLVANQPGLRSCTPAGIMELLHAYDIPVSGAEAVVVGRSDIVGKPVAFLLLHENATVTIAHSRTRDLTEVCRRADILIAAVGRPQMITGAMIKPGAAVIDVGINRTEAGLVGDVEFASASEVAGAITPVPGGVGPMTIAMLLQNTLEAAEARLATRSAV